MHRRIVEAIKDALTKREDIEVVKIFIDDKDSGGFWSMLIVVDPRYEHLISHIEDIGKRIGAYYGEGLFCGIWNNTIEFS